jgi:hypothetical protein
MVLVTSEFPRERIYLKIARSSGTRPQKRSPALSKAENVYKQCRFEAASNC